MRYVFETETGVDLPDPKPTSGELKLAVFVNTRPWELDVGFAVDVNAPDVLSTVFPEEDQEQIADALEVFTSTRGAGL